MPEATTPMTAHDLPSAGFYSCASVEHAIVPPTLLKEAVAEAGVDQADDGFWYFEVRPVCGNHLLRIRPVPASHFAVERGHEHSALKIVSRSLDKVAITSARYGQIHVYFLGVPITLYAWHFGPIVYVRRQLTDWALLTPDERRVLRDMHVQTQCPLRLG